MSEQNVMNELFRLPKAGELTNNDSLLSEVGLYNQKIYYITDIHIEHHVPKKEIKKFKKDPKPFITSYIRKLLKIPDEQENKSKKYDYLLVGGDVADSFEVTKFSMRFFVNTGKPLLLSQFWEITNYGIARAIRQKKKLLNIEIYSMS